MFLAFTIGLRHPPITGDVWSAELGAWRLATTGAPWLDGVSVDQLPPSWRVEGVESGALWTTTNPDNGHRVVARSPGAVLVAVPAYAVAGWFDGDDRLRDLPGSLTAALVTAVAMVLLLATALHHTRPPLAVGAASALALGTPVWSVAGNDLWPHSVGLLGVAGAAWAASNDRWWLVGLFGGVALYGRLHLAVVVAVVGVGVALARRRPSVALQVACGSLPFLALSSWWGHWLYGSWSPTTGYAARTLGAWPATRTWWEQLGDVLGTLVSPGVGLLVWTPCLLVLLPRLPRAWREAPDWGRALAVGGLAYLALQVYLNPFHGGTGFWGYRLPLETLACCFPLLVLAARHLGRRARATAVLLVGAQASVLAVGVLFGRASTNSDGSAWRTSPVLLTWQENPTAFLAFLVTGTGLVWLLSRRLVSTDARLAAIETQQAAG